MSSRFSTIRQRDHRAIFLGIIQFTAAMAVLMGLLLAADGGKWPWQRRIGKVEARHNLSYQHITADMWPTEPPSPRTVDADAFQTALGTLCGTMPPGRLEKYAATILEEADRFDVDPFILGALIFHQSGCRPKTPDFETRYGLTRIDINMHAPHIRSGEYRYFTKENGAWVRRVLKVDRYPFNKWKAQRSVSNIYWAAAILAVFGEQCPHLDKAFNGVPHRHPVSHWFYGDNVRGTEPEDATLTARRRLLQYYRNTSASKAGAFRDIPIYAPLDGTPRLVLDYFGNKRGNKRSLGHQGIDLAGLTGEPVRAVAKGRVVFAGADMPGNAKSRNLTPEQAEALSRNALGNGGLWIALNHGSGFRTCYMHLDSLAVTQQDTVEAGQIIGTLGNTGTASGPHLHLEFRTDKGGREDPAAHLRSVLVNPFGAP